MRRFAPYQGLNLGMQDTGESRHDGFSVSNGIPISLNF